ncbi:acyltransferase family protein [Limnoglobus roseus]|uniref:Acyltransferase n=1 Tax=Limnoglobus roseus TaxID=2598579 RepID=A0A5C1AJI6_9BACT|nr:acyltransferase [Limnoglobus roseus]QEL18166.1 acyltransferase [Limnoglobus roseus]
MRYTNLQAGRFAAAAAVLVFHVAGHGHAQLGLETVLIEPVPAYWFRTSIIFFFALSGFVLAHGLQTATLRRFLWSRLLRLYPAYWVAAGTVLTVRGLAGNQIAFDNRGLWYAFTLWPGGPNRAAYSLGIEWTLVYEVFLSLALIPCAALGRRWGLGLGATIWLAWIVGKLIATGGADFQPFPKPGQISLSALNAAFLLGVLAYLVRNSLLRCRWVLPPVSGVGLFVGGMFVESAVGWSLFWQSVGTVAALAYFVSGRQLAADNLFVRGGDCSYGIYLVHVPVMTAFYALVGPGSWAPFPVAAVGGSLAFAVGILYGAAEWRLYRKLRAAFKKPTPSVLITPPLAESVVVRRAA